jgi:hypothetical protein
LFVLSGTGLIRISSCNFTDIERLAKIVSPQFVDYASLLQGCTKA